jgi:hypothetical protein
MHTISIIPQSTMKLNIHNQCSDFKLTDNGYFSNGVHWIKYPIREVDAGSMMSADLIPFLSTFEGVLTHELKKESVKSIPIRLFVAWKSKGYKEFHVFVQLIEYDEKFFRYTTKLEMYYQRYVNQLLTYTGPIKDTWSLDYDTVLMTRLELDFVQRDSVLNLTISEGARDDHTKIPELIDPKM